MAQDATLRLRAGDGENGYAVNLFLPDPVYINEGDTLTWEFPWDEPHSVTFGEIAGNPEAPSHPDDAVVDYDGTGFVNSGLLFGNPETPPEFSVKFTQTGTFDYYCFIHPLMTGQVVVQEPGVGARDTQVALDARGEVAYNDAIASLKAAAAATAAQPVAVTGPAGARTYTVRVSSLNDLPVGDVMQFFPASLNVGLNDTVEFVSSVHTPHDVAFVPPGLDPTGPPPPGLEDFDPFTDSPNYSPGVKVDNTKPVISPVIGLDFPGGTKATFKFAKTGTYTYVCILHVAQGMMGQINVTSGSPLPPNTGDSFITGSSASGESGLLLVFGAVGFALAATGVAFATTRR